MTGAELQAARKAAAERHQPIAAKYICPGYIIEYRKTYLDDTMARAN